MSEPIVVVVGASTHPLRDVYHRLLRMPWPATLGSIVVAVLLVNALFALLYLASGGVAHAEPRSFRDAFVFSMQTFATIGYGYMYPESSWAHAIMVVESLVGLIATAISTGLVFTKFSVARARMVFSRVVVITEMNGVPTLMLRIGNDRRDQIFDAHVRLVLTRTERTAEGMTFYRMLDLPLARDRAPVLSRTFTIMHPIGPESPLHGASAEVLAQSEAELLVSVAGTDEVTLQPVHATHTYLDRQVLFDHRFADVLSELPDGRLLLDVRKFHEVVPALRRA